MIPGSLDDGEAIEPALALRGFKAFFRRFCRLRGGLLRLSRF